MDNPNDAINYHEIRKMGVWLPIPDETAIDLGWMEAPPVNASIRRRWRWQAQRRAFIHFLAAPLMAVERGAGWSHVALLNLLARAVGLRERYSHDPDGYGDEYD